MPTKRAEPQWPVYREDDDLPEGWVEAPLAEVLQIVPNFDPKTEPDRQFVYVDIGSIDNGSFSIAEPKQFLGRNAPSRAQRPIEPNDVLFSNVRTYLRNIALVPREPKADLCSTGFTVMRSNGAVEPRFLFLQVLSDGFLNAVTPEQTGSQYPATSDSAVRKAPCLIAPLPEQRRIVGQVDALLARVNAARARLARAPALLKTFRQAVLSAACSGKLTTEWRETHPVTESTNKLLNRLRSEREEQWQRRNPQRKYHSPEPLAEEELPSIPETWAWTNFDHCAWEITVGHVGPMKNRYVEQGIPFLRSQNVRPLRFEPAGLVFIDSVFHSSLRKSALVGNEILVTRSGANTGDCCVYPKNGGEANCADLVVTRPLSGLIPTYGAIYVSSPEGQARIVLRETGMAQPHFNIGAMRVKAFPLPPVDEQQEIVRRVESLFAMADDIEARMAAAQKRVEALTQAILAKAFRGELVPNEAALARAEGRSYESAAELLARLTSKRDAANLQARKNRG